MKMILVIAVSSLMLTLGSCSHYGKKASSCKPDHSCCKSGSCEMKKKKSCCDKEMKNCKDKKECKNKKDCKDKKDCKNKDKTQA